MQDQMVNISFPVSERILLSLKEGKDEFVQEMLYSMALRSYRRGKLSLGKAAELAGYSRLDFIDKLRLEGEVIFEYNLAELDQVFADAESL